MAQPVELSQAIATLDSIFASTPQMASVPNTSSLSKKRARTREGSAISTPALMQLLSGAKSTSKRRRLSLPSPSQLAEVHVGEARARSGKYAPHSLDALLDRISTYSLTVWSDSKPSGCDAADFSRHGWRATGKRREEVRCEVCEEEWRVKSAKDWRTEQGQTAAESMRRGLKERHSTGCPWRRGKSCDATLYQVPLSQPPIQTLREVATRAASLSQDQRLDILHPLSEEQLDGLDQLATIPKVQRVMRDGVPPSLNVDTLVVGILGWQAYSASASSVTALSSPSSSTPPSNPSTILQCKYCSRRVLAKSLPPSSASEEEMPPSRSKATVNLRTSHRKFCPHILPVSSDDSREGWQAILDAITSTSQDADLTHSQGTDIMDLDPLAKRQKVSFILKSLVGLQLKVEFTQGREAVQLVRELLSGSRVIKQKQQRVIV